GFELSDSLSCPDLSGVRSERLATSRTCCSATQIGQRPALDGLQRTQRRRISSTEGDGRIENLWPGVRLSERGYCAGETRLMEALSEIRLRRLPPAYSPDQSRICDRDLS